MRRLHRLMTAATFGAVTMVAARAEAFDYPEHVLITHDGIDLFIGSDAARRAFLDQERVWLASTHACPKDAWFDSAASRCLGIADIVALAGDHSSSPINLKWRWFNDGLIPARPRSSVAVGLAALGGLTAGQHPPDEALSDAPAFDDFIAYIRTFADSAWPQQTSPDDFKLSKVDSAYVGFAERGHPHFRPSYCGPEDATILRSANERNPPMNAFAWYADLHTGAIETMRASRACRDTTCTLDFQGSAVLLELYALHFLEDGLSAGHMVVDATRTPAAALNANHDAFCSAGLAVSAPSRDLCEHGLARTPGSLPFFTWCDEKTSQDVMILGDHELARRGVHALSDPAKRWSSLTASWASVLVAVSLDEVWRERRGPIDNVALGFFPEDAPDRCELQKQWDVTVANQASDDSLFLPPCSKEPRCDTRKRSSYDTLIDWWGRQPVRHRPLIQSQWRDYQALKALPVPAVLRRFEYRCEAGVPTAKAQELGHLREFAGVTAEVEAGGVVGGANQGILTRIGMSFTPPDRRVPFPFDVGIGISAVIAPSASSLSLMDLQARARPFGGQAGSFHVLGRVGLAVAGGSNPGPTIGLEWLVGGGFTLSYGNFLKVLLEAGGGYVPAAGFGGVFGLAFLWSH